MGYEQQSISTDELEIGMYVARLDRPWNETPLPLQGFCIKSDAEIELLKSYCKRVYIDRRCPRQQHHDKSTGSVHLEPHGGSETASLPLPPPQAAYTETTGVEKELKVAVISYENLTRRFKSLFSPFKSSKEFNAAELEQSITAMVESIIRNPDAFSRLTILKEKDDYTYEHCINMAIISVVFGRHLGLTRDDLHVLAWGAMFCDVGKARLPMVLLNRIGRLSDEEFEITKHHVNHSIDAAKSIENFSPKAIEIIQHHHERFNGSGYPDGLKGKEIPVFCRIVSIADDYDAMIHERPYARPISPHEAIRELYEFRNVAYQAELVEAFIRAIGVYPLGTIVELSTGQVGVVISQNKIRHLKPRIMLILDQNKVAYSKYPLLDLLEEPLDQNGRGIVIEKVLEPGSYGIKP